MDKLMYYVYDKEQKCLRGRSWMPDNIGFRDGTIEEFERAIKAYDLLYPDNLYFSSIESIPSHLLNDGECNFL